MWHGMKRLNMTRSGPGSDRGLPSTHIGMSDRSIYEIKNVCVIINHRTTINIS